MPTRFKGNNKFRGLAEQLLKTGKPPTGSRVVTKVGSRIVYEIPQPGGKTVFAKIIPPKKGLAKAVASVFRPSYAFAEYEKARRIRQKSINGPKPLAALEQRGKIGLFGRSVLITRGLEGKKILEFAEQLPEKEKRALIYSFADFCREMHSKGILHKDLKNEHVFVQQTPKGFSFALLDFGGTKIKKITTKDKISEFYRTEANFSLSQKKGLITNTDKLRF